MKKLSKEQILMLHSALIKETGGSAGVRDYNLLESAVENPFQSFDGEELYPTIQAKAARLNLAVDRRYKKDGEAQNADFINCVAFGKQASFLEKFGKKGVKFIVTGRIQTGSYEKDGVKVYTTDVVIEELEFCESKRNDDSAPGEFMNIPDGIDDEVPFK